LENKVNRWTLPILFIVVLLSNYLSAMGVLVPLTQAEVSNKYTNLLAPAGFTFSIWGIIYLGVILTLVFTFIKRNNEEFQNSFQGKISTLFIQWMVLNIIWIFTWSYEWLVISLIAIVLYAFVMMRLAGKVAKDPVLNKHKWFLVYPIGLHFGWMLAATFANLTTTLVSFGIPGTGWFGIAWTIAALLTIVAIATFYTFRYRNFSIFIPSLWTLIGVMSKHSPSAGFEHAETILFIFSIGLFILGIIISVNYFNKQKD